MSRFDQVPVDPAALTVATTVPMLVATFQEAERDIRAAFASIVAAEKRQTPKVPGSWKHSPVIGPSHLSKWDRGGIALHLN